MKEARTGVSHAEQHAALAHKSGIKESMAEQLTALDRLSEAEKNILETRKKSVETLTAQKDQARELRKQGVEALENANAQVEAEKRKYEARGAGLAKLDPAKHAAVTNIGMKLSRGGKLNDIDAKILDETGYGSKLTRKYYFDKLGKDDKQALGALGEHDGVRDAQDDREDALDKLADARDEELKITDKLNDAKKKELEAVNTLADVVRRIAELNNRRDGLNVTLAPVPKAAVEAAPKVTSSSSGDVASAVDSANTDITNSTDKSIDALNYMASLVTKQGERLQAAIHRGATLLQMNTL